MNFLDYILKFTKCSLIDIISEVQTILQVDAILKKIIFYLDINLSNMNNNSQPFRFSVYNVNDVLLSALLIHN